jgi:hypothetical protein
MIKPGKLYAGIKTLVMIMMMIIIINFKSETIKLPASGRHV